jgi:hypothetical protein
MLLVCDNTSVHKADELKKLMNQYGIILRFLPPNMTQCMQPLDRVIARNPWSVPAEGGDRGLKRKGGRSNDAYPQGANWTLVGEIYFP